MTELGAKMGQGHDLAMALRAAYLAMHRCADAHLAAGGVTADQFVLLSLLAEGDSVTQRQLVRRAGSDANTVRAMLVLLEKRALVSRRPHPTDGRARSVCLTAKGRQTYERLWADSQPFRRRLLTAVDAGKRRTLVESLRRVAEAMK